MHNHRHKSDLKSMREDFELKQKATLWPDSARASRGVDEFLWKGNAKATTVQRVGLVIFSLMFISAGLLLILAAFKGEAESVTLRTIFGAIGTTGFAVGMRFWSNAFRRSTKKP